MTPLLLLLLAARPIPQPAEIIRPLWDAFLSVEGHPPTRCSDWVGSPALFMIPQSTLGQALRCRDLKVMPHSGAGEGRYGLFVEEGVVFLYGPDALLAERPIATRNSPVALGAAFARFLGSIRSSWSHQSDNSPEWGDLQRYGGNLLDLSISHSLWGGSLKDHTLPGDLSRALSRLKVHQEGWVVDLASGWLYEVTITDDGAVLSPYPFV
ncbi:hypothetical protein H8D30_03075 [bacterium]|nr:hypothetical protein [bacterium]